MACVDARVVDATEEHRQELRGYQRRRVRRCGGLRGAEVSVKHRDGLGRPSRPLARSRASRGPITIVGCQAARALALFPHFAPFIAWSGITRRRVDLLGRFPAVAVLLHDEPQRRGRQAPKSLVSVHEPAVDEMIEDGQAVRGESRHLRCDDQHRLLEGRQSEEVEELHEGDPVRQRPEAADALLKGGRRRTTHVHFAVHARREHEGHAELRHVRLHVLRVVRTRDGPTNVARGVPDMRPDRVGSPGHVEAQGLGDKRHHLAEALRHQRPAPAQLRQREAGPVPSAVVIELVEDAKNGGHHVVGRGAREAFTNAPDALRRAPPDDRVAVAQCPEEHVEHVFDNCGNDRGGGRFIGQRRLTLIGGVVVLRTTPGATTRLRGA